jgi:hypothetical protein
MNFLHELLLEGTITHQERPRPEAPPVAEALRLLQKAYATHCLSITGPEISFVPELALAAAEVVRHASWFLLSHQEPPEHVQAQLRMPRTPMTPGCHLSVDVTFRYLPTLHRRAQARDATDVLSVRLNELLRQWPFSGILGAVEEPPLTSLEFGHPGLQLCYAERFVTHAKAAWLPAGQGLEAIEWAWAESGRDKLILENWKKNNGVHV